MSQAQTSKLFLSQNLGWPVWDYVSLWGCCTESIVLFLFRFFTNLAADLVTISVRATNNHQPYLVTPFLCCPRWWTSVL